MPAPPQLSSITVFERAHRINFNSTQLNYYGILRSSLTNVLPPQQFVLAVNAMDYSFVRLNYSFASILLVLAAHAQKFCVFSHLGTSKQIIK